MASRDLSSARWIDLSDAEKKEVIRLRNVEQCRKNRRRWKESDEEMKAIYESNEKKIDELEKLATKLSSELRTQKLKTSSSNSSSR